MKFMKLVGLVLIGIVFGPFLWAYNRFVLRLPPVPSEFWSLSGHFEKHNLGCAVKMQKDKPEGIISLATFCISPHADNFKVLTVALCESTDEADRQSTEARKNPVLSHVTCNGSLVMTCTFFPPDEATGLRAQQAFRSFVPALSQAAIEPAAQQQVQGPTPPPSAGARP